MHTQADRGYVLRVIQRSYTTLGLIKPSLGNILPLFSKTKKKKDVMVPKEAADLQVIFMYVIVLTLLMKSWMVAPHKH